VHSQGERYTTPCVVCNCNSIKFNLLPVVTVKESMKRNAQVFSENAKNIRVAKVPDSIGFTFCDFMTVVPNTKNFNYLNSL